METMLELTRRLAAAENRRRTAPRASAAYERALREADAIRRQIWQLRYEPMSRRAS